MANSALQLASCHCASTQNYLVLNQMDGYAPGGRCKFDFFRDFLGVVYFFLETTITNLLQITYDNF